MVPASRPESVRPRPSRRCRRPIAVHIAPGLIALASLASRALLPTPAFAQNPAPPARDALRVYLDCSGGRGSRGCSSDLYRQEITFVNWVRQPQDAQVHVMITSQSAGGGGTRYSIDLIGRDDLDGMSDELTTTSSVTDVQDETLNDLVRVLSLGLVRFATSAGFGDRLSVVSSPTNADPQPDRAEPLAPQEDPWDSWVFNINGGADVEREDLQESWDLDFGLSANRTTESWKINVRASGNFSRESFELVAEDRTVRNDQDRWSTSAYGVRSLGDHWGVGAEVGADNSTRLNRKLQVGFGSGVEYNYFPYAESNRRVLLARYVASVESAQYRETTVFDVLEETVYLHDIDLSYEAREPWGNAVVGAGVRQYLDRTSAWSAQVSGFVRYRLFRGFSVNVSGELGTVRDQIYLPRRTLSEEDILLGRRQLPTEARKELSVGFSYSFGSIFNNAVNQRFRRGIR